MGNANSIKVHAILQIIALQQCLCSPFALWIARPVVQRVECAKSLFIHAFCLLVLAIHLTCRGKDHLLRLTIASIFQHIHRAQQIAFHDANRIRIDEIGTGVPCQMEYVVHLFLVCDRLADILNQQMEIRLANPFPIVFLRFLAISAKSHHFHMDIIILMQIEQQPSHIQGQHARSPSHKDGPPIELPPRQLGLTHPLHIFYNYHPFQFSIFNLQSSIS